MVVVDVLCMCEGAAVVVVGGDGLDCLQVRHPPERRWLRARAHPPAGAPC